jgi:hypothetical protein
MKLAEVLQDDDYNNLLKKGDKRSDGKLRIKMMLAKARKRNPKFGKTVQDHTYANHDALAGHSPVQGTIFGNWE